jgi:tRNA(adenine34) deaminase
MEDALLDLALGVAADGLAAGELPIGAVVVLSGEVIARSATQEKSQSRRLVHAELLALTAADRKLGFGRRDDPLILAVTLEPCFMCLGAAAAMGVESIFYGVESPGDGAAELAGWKPQTTDLPAYEMPVVTGGIRRSQCQDLFRRYVAAAPESGLRRWAQTIAELA